MRGMATVKSLVKKLDNCRLNLYSVFQEMKKPQFLFEVFTMNEVAAELYLPVLK